MPRGFRPPAAVPRYARQTSSQARTAAPGTGAPRMRYPRTAPCRCGSERRWPEDDRSSRRRDVWTRASNRLRRRTAAKSPPPPDAMLSTQRQRRRRCEVKSTHEPQHNPRDARSTRAPHNQRGHGVVPQRAHHGADRPRHQQLKLLAIEPVGQIDIGEASPPRRSGRTAQSRAAWRTPSVADRDRSARC